MSLNSAFEGSLYGTSMQSLTLVIWGARRTFARLGFEPLISKASKCDSFEGKGTPEAIYHLDSKMTQSRESRARVFRWWWTTWPDSCGAGAPFQAAASGRRSSVGGG